MRLSSHQGEQKLPILLYGVHISLTIDGTPAVLNKAFDRVEVVQTVVHFEEGQPIARWNILICRGFKGFPADQLSKQGW